MYLVYYGSENIISYLNFDLNHGIFTKHLELTKIPREGDADVLAAVEKYT